MKVINIRRHRKALERELGFWRRPDIIMSQAFRIDRYRGCLLEVARSYSENRTIERVLDVGCGPACCAQFIPDGKKYYVDPLLEEYKALFPGQIPEGSHRACRIEEAKLEADSFDIIVSLNSFDHVQDPWRALAIIFEALKEGGNYVFSIYTRSSIWAFLRNLQERLCLSTDVAHPYTFTNHRMNQNLLEAGFQIESTQTLTEDRVRSENLWVCRK